MAQLTKGMYGNYLYPKAGPFGLYSGQMRGGKTRLTKNSGWYHKLGEKLGFGDLNVADFRRISRGLKKDEFFIVLSETDSKWRFLSSINGMPKVKPPAEAPGVDYVAEHAMYVIARNQLYYVDHYGDLMSKKILKLRSLSFKVLNTNAVKVLIATGVLV